MQATLSSPVTRPSARAASSVRGTLLWILAAAGLGLAVSGLFSSALELPRLWLVAAYLAVVGPFLVAYARWSRIDLVALLRHRWPWGIAGAVGLGAFMVQRVLMDEASPRSDGARLVWELLWLGVVYGLLDALLLIVLPVHAVRQAFVATGRATGWKGRLLMGVVATAASLLVTTAYHLGYAEFRGEELRAPIIGSGLTSIAYLATANPLTAVLTHIALHVVSVLHGIDSTVTLPPHY